MKAAKKGKKKGKKKAGATGAAEDVVEDFLEDQDVNMAEPVNPKITKEPPKVAPAATLKATDGGVLKIDDSGPIKVPEQTQQEKVENGAETSKIDDPKIKKKKTKLKIQDDEYGDE